VGTDVEKVIGDKFESFIFRTNFAILNYFSLSFNVGSDVKLVKKVIGRAS